MKRIIVVSLVLAALLIACITPISAYAQELTPNENAYATTIADHSMRVGQALIELGDLMQNPQIGDDKWTLMVAAQIVTIRALYDEAMGINPPSSMTHIHYKYVQAMKHFESSTHLLTQGVDELNAELLDQATTELLTGSQLINEATKLMEEFTETRTKEVSPPPPTPPKPEEKEDDGCFIATAAYGTDTAEELNILREFRDEVLISNSLGVKLVSFYYNNSPPIADFISEHEVLRTIVREGFVDPIVTILNWTRNLWSE